jgi:hypothetical protein
MKAIVVFASFVLIGAVILGVALSDSEFLNPDKGAAEAEKIRAEIAAFVAENGNEQRHREIELKALEEQAAYEQRRREIELKALENQTAYEHQLHEIELRALEEQAKQQAAVEGQALAARWAKELELMERNAQLKAELFELGARISLGVVVMLGGAAAFRLLCGGPVRLRREKQPAAEVIQQDRRVIRFPGLLQRVPGLVNKPATALALLALGIGILTVSVTLFSL